MNAATLKVGCILHWKDFEFSDGTKADKYLVLVGCKAGANYLAVLGTSKKHKRTFSPGCTAADSYYHIPGGTEWFPKDTWLVLAEAVEISPAELLRLTMVEKKLTICGQLREQIANAIKNCLKMSPDVSAAQLALL